MEGIAVAAVTVFSLIVVWKAVRTLKGGHDYVMVARGEHGSDVSIDWFRFPTETWPNYSRSYTVRDREEAMKKLPDAINAMEFNRICKTQK